MLSWTRFCYLDTEYMRPDYRVAPLDKFSSSNVELFSIQFALMKLKRNRYSIPKLNVLTRESSKSELDILKEFWPTWKLFFGNITRPKRLIPMGFVLTADLQILANKYDQYRQEISEMDPNATEKHFNLSHVLQITRFFDLQWPFQLKHGLVDLSLCAVVESLNNKDTKDIIHELLKPNIEQRTRTQLEQRFATYVQGEYEAVLDQLWIVLKKTGGIFRPNPSSKPIP